MEATQNAPDHQQTALSLDALFEVSRAEKGDETNEDYDQRSNASFSNETVPTDLLGSLFVYNDEPDDELALSKSIALFEEQRSTNAEEGGDGYVQISEDDLPRVMEYLRQNQTPDDPSTHYSLVFKEPPHSLEPTPSHTILQQQPVTDLTTTTTTTTTTSSSPEPRLEMGALMRKSCFASEEEEMNDEFADDDWVLVDEAALDDMVKGIVPWAPIPQDNALAIKTGMFNDWPAFGIGEKLCVVAVSSFFGFVGGWLAGSIPLATFIAALHDRPVLVGGATLGTAYMAPSAALFAAKLLVFGGVAAGAALAVPILVVGAGGVFVSAAVHHAWTAAERVVS